MVEVLPVVTDLDHQWRPGWCTYSDDFDDLPEVEVFCGGINTKTVTAAALWRQGHLLHFGFDLSPAEMNETGQSMLLNSIAYISRFTEDRPIAVTPSVFAGPVPRMRYGIRRMLDRDSVESSQFEYSFAPSVLQSIRDKDIAGLRTWFAENGDFLYPQTDGRLAIDAEAKALEVAPSRPQEFFPKAIASLRGDDAAAEAAATLLRRYAPEGPSGASAEAWAKWWADNSPYLFFSEAGGYRYYTDPLAKKRGVPSLQLRGPARASRPG